MSFRGRDAPYYEHSGVRKAVELTRYANLMRNWVNYELASVAGASPEDPPEGVEYASAGRWEDGSVPLQVSAPYDSRVREFRTYVRSEMAALGDDSMQRDLEVLDHLVAASTTGTTRENGANATARADHGEHGPQASDDGDCDGGGFSLSSPTVLDVAGLFATVVIGRYGAKKRNRGL